MDEINLLVPSILFMALGFFAYKGAERPDGKNLPEIVVLGGGFLGFMGFIMLGAYIARNFLGL